MKHVDFNSMVKGIFPIVISGVFLLFFPLLAQGVDIPILSTQYCLTTSATPVEGGTVTPSGTTCYDSGQIVSITATPNADFLFDHWNIETGNFTSISNPVSINMDGNKDVTANFITPNCWYNIGPEGANVSILAINPQNPNTLYAVAPYSGGIIKSTGGGTTWRVMYNAFPGAINALVIDPLNPDNLYVAIGTSGVFKSTDGAKTWNAANAGLTNPEVSHLVIDPQSPNILYAGTTRYCYWIFDSKGRPINQICIEGGLFKTTDGGATWNTTSLTGIDVGSLIINPQTPNTIYATYSGIFKSTDGGETWNALGFVTGSYLQMLAMDPQNPNVLYAGTWMDGVFKTMDGGETWINISQSLIWMDIRTLIVDPNTTSNLYAGTNRGGVFKSTDGGVTWTATNNGLYDTSVQTLVIDHQNSYTLYVGTSYIGIFKTVDGGETWDTLSTGLTDTHIQALAADPDLPNTIHAGTDGNIFKSINGGVTWKPTTQTGIYASTLVVDDKNPGTVYAGGRGILKSTDSGESWNEINAGLRSDWSGPPTVDVLFIDPQNSRTIYAGIAVDIYKSMDAGNTWNKMAELPSDILTISIHQNNPLTIYIGTDGNGVFKSTNGGGTWNGTGLTHYNYESGSNIPVFALVIDPNDSGIVYAGTDGGLFKSLDGGATWNGIGLISSVRTLFISPQDPNILYIGTRGSGVFKSMDGGTSCFPINSGLTDLLVNILAVDPQNPDILYAGTEGCGVFKIQQIGYPYTITTNPSGLEIIVDGSSRPAPQTFIWPSASSHTISVTSPQDGTSGTRFVFSSWSDGGDQTHAITAPSSSTTYTATFITQHELTITSSPLGGGTVTPSPMGDQSGIACIALVGVVCAGYYSSGTLVTLTPTPITGYIFSNWSGDLSGTNNPTSINMNAPKNVTANFTQNQYTLTVNIAPSGSGSVAKNPDKASYTYGEQVQLTAMPSSGYSFSGWIGDVSGTTNPITLTIDNNKTITVNFIELIGPDLTGSWTTPVTQTCKNTRKGPKCTIKGVLTINNNGNRDASSSTVKVYLSDSNTYDQGDTPLMSAATGKIKAKQSKSIKLSKSFPLGQIVTGKYIIAVIDRYNSVKEIDEANNVIVFGPIQ